MDQIKLRALKNAYEKGIISQTEFFVKLVDMASEAIAASSFKLEPIGQRMESPEVLDVAIQFSQAVEKVDFTYLHVKEGE